MSKPVELYRFTQGAFVQGFTSGNRLVMYNNVPYVPVAMERSSVSVTDDVYKSSLTLTFARTVPFALDMLNYSNEIPFQVSVFRGEQGGSSWILNWSGRAISAKANGDEIEIECESLYTTVVRPGLRARYTKTCRHELYDQGCQIDYDSSRVQAELLEVTDSVNLRFAEAAGFPDGYFTAGIVDAGPQGARFILDHQGDIVRINRPIDIPVGSDVSLLAGCDHLRSTCQAKFNNEINFGGWPWIPDVNPFGGGRIQ
ncbi:tail assembly protein [Vibrio phage VpKK5]|uniref:tail assembly protein n=1 Tax=Vibrio phage VpKK5 TaxID=1538804 RepID=UPI0004F818F2|nr:tail assembly protein [Vibrio phage VpKK5]AIM40627.1 tail assembly protein [Vibrio phage VpKK5]